MAVLHLKDLTLDKIQQRFASDETAREYIESLTNDIAQDEMLTKRELAAKPKVTVRTIENWQHDGFLTYVKIPSVVLFHWPEVLEQLKAILKFIGVAFYTLVIRPAGAG
jgi:hypothetical protein